MFKIKDKNILFENNSITYKNVIVTINQTGINNVYPKSIILSNLKTENNNQEDYKQSLIFEEELEKIQKEVDESYTADNIFKKTDDFLKESDNVLNDSAKFVDKINKIKKIADIYNKEI